MAEQQATINIDKDDVTTSVPAVITSIQQGDYYAPFGMSGEDILVYSGEEEVWGTVQNFFEEWMAFKETWKDFINNAKFIQYEHSTVTGGPYAPDFGVKTWFEVNDQIQIVTPTVSQGE